MSPEEEIEEALAEAVQKSANTEQPKNAVEFPNQVFVVPLSRRPFFPGMAAPIVIEPGAFYEVLKMVAKSEHKFHGSVSDEARG